MVACLCSVPSKNVIGEMDALGHFKESFEFRWALKECLEALCVPERLLRRALLLFLGDRTDCLFCVAVTHFLLFLVCLIG